MGFIIFDARSRLLLKHTPNTNPVPTQCHRVNTVEDPFIASMLLRRKSINQSVDHQQGIPTQRRSSVYILKASVAQTGAETGEEQETAGQCAFH